MELLNGGDLITNISKRDGSWTERDASSLFKKLLLAIHHCHS